MLSQKNIIECPTTKNKFFLAELPMVAMFVDGSGQNEQSLERTFLPTKFHFI
jgi:hypothetical protein